MSYCYFLFIFSWYVKPKLISEKFEAIFVKHFLPWNLTASKRCSSQIGPETPQKILRGAFSMPKSNSKHTRKWWDSFLIFWLGANSLPRTCDWFGPVKSLLSVLAEAGKVGSVCWQITRKVLRKNYISSVKTKVAWFLKTFCAVVVIFEMSWRKAITFVKSVNNGFFWNILFVLVKYWYTTLNDIIWQKATALQVKTWNLQTAEQNQSENLKNWDY